MKNTWPTDINKPIDVICMGRVAVDLYAEQTGIPLAEASTFKKYLGGCAGNIAVGCARLGLRAAMFSRIGNDAMGHFLRNELLREKVDITMLGYTDSHLTGLVLLGIMPPDHFPLIFYRENCADMQIKKEHAHIDFIAKTKALLITGTGLSTSAMRDVTRHTIKIAKSVQTHVILDLDFRPVLWGLTTQGDGETRYKQSDEVSKHYQEIVAHCDLIVGTEEEIMIAGNTNDLHTALINLRTLTRAPLIVKQGSQGCFIFFDDLDSLIAIPGFPVQVLNVLGAGDAFMSGLLRGLLRGESWETSATWGNACGAIVVTRHGCAPAMPYFNEMQNISEAGLSEATNKQQV